MKRITKKYRGIIVIASALLFNLISSLLVWHPAGQIFNIYPLTVTEWICDIISTVLAFTGAIMSLYDVNADMKQK